VEIVREPAEQRGFAVHPRRWVVERTLAWLTAHRLLARDYERHPEVAEHMIRWAGIGGMLNRLARGAPATRQRGTRLTHPASTENDLRNRPATDRRCAPRRRVLHTSSALSALMLELRWMRTGGDQNTIPDTQGAEYLACPPRPGQDLVRPSDSPASWALAVYVAR
jgi:hypothetical protein